MEILNVPKTKEGEAFEKIFMAGFNPLKNHIQYNNLYAKLTPDDLHMLAHALAEGLGQWCEFLKRADDERDSRRGGY